MTQSKIWVEQNPVLYLVSVWPFFVLLTPLFVVLGTRPTDMVWWIGVMLGLGDLGDLSFHDSKTYNSNLLNLLVFACPHSCWLRDLLSGYPGPTLVWKSLPGGVIVTTIPPAVWSFPCPLCWIVFLNSGKEISLRSGCSSMVDEIISLYKFVWRPQGKAA